ncbi:uncharacterized protein ATC70_012791 [Mucor velutinosus]|uniref:Uncharacterized protein n=1 Tax=Mucor velutinosus TaxID=708070 RepID=A0AAN7DBS1_9FUNG|nr:hypothetical protein ATC70_012791 [Mucor velutinosus]
MSTFTRLSTLLTRQTRPFNRTISRSRITITNYNASETSNVHRPTPVLLLRTNKDDKIPCLWQQKFSELGYSSVQAYIELPQDQEPLQTSYGELKQATTELSFFPPLMISFGQVAWRISQKYVSNKPVSGLVMVEASDDDSSSELLQKYPMSEFEPHFPLLMLSNSNPPPFLDGWVDHSAPHGTDTFGQVVDWMDQVGM